jgi:hypothetical protein
MIVNSEIGIYWIFSFFGTKTRFFKMAFIDVVLKTGFGIFKKKSVQKISKSTYLVIIYLRLSIGVQIMIF